MQPFATCCNLFWAFPTLRICHHFFGSFWDGLRCRASASDVTLSAVSALRGAAAAVVEEATKVIGAAGLGDGEAEVSYDNSSAAGRRLGAPPTAMVAWMG